MANLQFAAFGQDDNRLAGTDIGQVLLTTGDMALCSRPLLGDDKGLEIRQADLSMAQAWFVVNVRWASPGFGYLWMQADNGGQSYRIPRTGSAQVWNLNYELARSRVLWNSQLEQAGRTLGVFVPKDLVERLNRAGAMLHDAMFANHDRRSRLADDTLAQAAEAGERLAIEVARWRITHPPSQPPKPSQPPNSPEPVFRQLNTVRWGADLPQEAAATWATLFDEGIVNFSAQDLAGSPSEEVVAGLAFLESLRDEGRATRKVRGRALLPYVDQHGQPLPAESPEQLAEWRDAAVELVRRHRGCIGTWELLPPLQGMNLAAALAPQLAEVAAAVKAACPDVQVVLRIGEIFPWRMQLEDQAPGRPRALPKPLEVVRRCLQDAPAIDAVALPLYWPGCDLLQLLRTIDAVAKVGRPLELLMAAAPSRWHDDPRADLGAGQKDFTRGLGYWRQPWSPGVQANYGLAVALLARAHPAVRALEWSDFSDAAPHTFPYGGLLDESGQAKPLCTALLEARRTDYRLDRPWPDGI